MYAAKSRVTIMHDVPDRFTRFASLWRRDQTTCLLHAHTGIHISVLIGYALHLLCEYRILYSQVFTRKSRLHHALSQCSVVSYCEFMSSRVQVFISKRMIPLRTINMFFNQFLSKINYTYIICVKVSNYTLLKFNEMNFEVTFGHCGNV